MDNLLRFCLIGYPELGCLSKQNLISSKSLFQKMDWKEYGIGCMKKRLEELYIMIMTPYGGRISEISESEIPFPHRAGNIGLIQYLIYWEEEGNVTESQMRIDWIRRLYNYMTPFVSKNPRAAYLNYRDLDIGTNNNQGTTSYAQSSIWGTKYFKNNFNKLVRVKTTVDPTNFFKNEQSIPPLSSTWKKRGH